MYKLEQSTLEENGYHYTDTDLGKNESICKKLRLKNTGRKILVLKDLSQININSNMGKGYKNISDDTKSIDKITDLNDVYAKDLTDGKMYYIKDDKIWSIDGTLQINELPFERVEGTVGDWKTIDNDDGTITLVQYLGNEQDVVIPNFYDGKIVTGIRRENGSSKVWELNTTVSIDGTQSQVNDTIKSIKISDGIENIGDGAFLRLSGIKSIEIPSSVNTIGSFAFHHCYNLTGNLVIPDSVTEIGEYAFFYCKSLIGDIIIPNNTESIGEFAFTKDIGFNGKIIIGNRVKKIGKCCFQDCENLIGDLNLPDGLETIEEGAFCNCSNLNGTLSIGKNVKTIESYAFKNCEKMKGKLIIPDSVVTIMESAFENCKSFNYIKLGKNLNLIMQVAFRNCENLEGTVDLRGINLEGNVFNNTPKLNKIYN